MFYCQSCNHPVEDAELATDANGEKCCPWCDGYRLVDVEARVDSMEDAA